jgi:4-hydroxyphenylpyruvate dioxygenase
MRKSIATVSLSGTLEEKLAAAAQVGFDGIELFENDLIGCPLTPVQIGRRAVEFGLRIELYQPFRDFEGGPDEVLAANLRRAEHKFDVMAQLGVGTILVCSTVSPRAVGDDARAVDHLGLLAELAATHGVRVAYEALAWGRYVNDYAHAWKLVAAVDHPNLGVCLDSFHILSRGDDPAGIRDIPGEKVFFVQLADAPAMHLDVLQWSRHYRCFPGQGDFDLTEFMAHVLSTGYDGPLSLEVFNDVFRQADADRTATDALRSLVALEESLGARLAPSTTEFAARDRVALATIDPPAELAGYSFVEIAVDPLAELAAQSLLRGMGFVPAGRHRSKPVQMWRHGDARVLLNRGRPGREDRPRGEATVCAIAVESADPVRSAARAQALLAPAIPRRYGPGEADLRAVAAPDGTAVFFCRTDASDATSWLADFEVDDGEPEHRMLYGVTHVDYVALSQPAFAFDEAALFYRSVFGLRRHDSAEVADPYGLVRGSAVSNEDRRVRLLLTMPALGGGPLPESAGYHHVAFACEDVFAAAMQMRSARLPTLSVPGNYYDDLAARTNLHPATIDTMREFAILYDADDQGGMYFHFFTAMFGRRMFFELVQRGGGYDGYGTPNTAVRTAAQYRHLVLAGLIG